MSDYNEQTLMEAVLKRVAATPDPRLRQMLDQSGQASAYVARNSLVPKRPQCGPMHPRSQRSQDALLF